MKTKKLYCGSVSKTCEYEVRELDEDGEALDVNHFDSKREAMDHMKRIESRAVAIVVEKVTKYFPARFGDDKYERIAFIGNQDALRMGGWID
jgi:predicted small metal-binding protein